MQKLTNTRGEELLLFRIDRFLAEYPACAKRLAEIVVSLSGTWERISTAKLERQFYLPHSAADAMMQALKGSKAVVRMHEPTRDVICLDKEQATRLADHIISFANGAK